MLQTSSAYADADGVLSASTSASIYEAFTCGPQEIKNALGIGASGITIGKYDSLAAARSESTPVRG